MSDNTPQDESLEEPTFETFRYDKGYSAKVAHIPSGLHVDVKFAGEYIWFLRGEEVLVSIDYWNIDNMIELFQEAKRQIDEFIEKGVNRD